MHGGRDQGSRLGAQHPPALLGHAKALPQHGLRRGCAQAHDNRGTDHLDLGVEPGTAGVNFYLVGLLVNSALASRLPLEVLNGVGHVDVATVYSRSLQGLVQQRARRPDKRTPRKVFFVPRLLADE